MQQVSTSAIEYLYGWAEVLLAPLLAIAISVIYFKRSPSSQSVRSRLLASAHGFVMATFYFGAMSIFWTNRASPRYEFPFAVLLVIPLVLILLSFFIYRGPKFVHSLQILNLLCWAWMGFIGIMAVTGNWL